MTVKIVNISQSVVSHWQLFNFSSSSCSLSSWSRNSFRVAVPEQDSYQCMMRLLLSMLPTIFLIMSLYVKSQSIASTINATFWWALQMQIEWVSRQRTLRIHYLHLGVFLWKQYIILASYKDFWKLQSFWLCAPLLTHTNINFLFRQLPAEIVICIDVCYQMKCFSGDRFSFLGAGFANIFFDIYIYFFDIQRFWTVNSRPFIRYEGKKLDLFRIWCYF